LVEYLIDACLGCKDHKCTLGFNIGANSFMVVIKPCFHDMAEKILDYLSNAEHSRKLTAEFVLRYFDDTLLGC
jgi:meiotically up-regulated gene 157 (Mug157) protein